MTATTTMMPVDLADDIADISYQVGYMLGQMNSTGEILQSDEREGVDGSTTGST